MLIFGTGGLTTSGRTPFRRTVANTRMSRNSSLPDCGRTLISAGPHHNYAVFSGLEINAASAFQTGFVQTSGCAQTDGCAAGFGGKPIKDRNAASYCKESFEIYLKASPPLCDDSASLLVH
jgi:hypothetical protein